MWNWNAPRGKGAGSPGDDPELSAPPMLAAARTKVKLFLEFLENNDDGETRPSRFLVEDYNRLRDMIIDFDPKLASIMPPAIPNTPPAEGAMHPEVTHAELYFFCEQIASFLK